MDEGGPAIASTSTATRTITLPAHSSSLNDAPRLKRASTSESLVFGGAHANPQGPRPASLSQQLMTTLTALNNAPDGLAQSQAARSLNGMLPLPPDVGQVAAQALPVALQALLSTRSNRDSHLELSLPATIVQLALSPLAPQTAVVESVHVLLQSFNVGGGAAAASLTWAGRLLAALPAHGSTPPLESLPSAHAAVMSTALSALNDGSSVVRRTGLIVLGLLATSRTVRSDDGEDFSVLARPDPSRTRFGTENSDLMTLLARYLTDPDARVRAAAVVSLSQAHGRGIPLPLGLYPKIVTSLGDIDVEVRAGATRLLWIYAQEQAKDIAPAVVERGGVQGLSGVGASVIDDAFSRLCHMVMDSSPTVRAAAVRLLGSLPGVHPMYLLQTLSKKTLQAPAANTGGGGGKARDPSKPFTAMDAANAAASVDRLAGARLTISRSTSLLAAASLSGGTRQEQGIASSGVMAPEGDIDVAASEADVSLMVTGAAGAFVHGLEDEFYEVRAAALDAISALGAHHSAFGAAAAEFVVDMFHDEIDSVRLNAVASLRALTASNGDEAGIGATILRRDQVGIILALLEDASPRVRGAVHELLAAAPAPSIDAARAVIHALLDNLSRYPEDFIAVHRAAGALGAHSAHAVAALSDELLRLDPMYAAIEPHVDTPGYTAVLTAIMHAAAAHPPLLAKLPGYVIKHYNLSYHRLATVLPVIRINDVAMIKDGSRPLVYMTVGNGDSGEPNDSGDEDSDDEEGSDGSIDGELRAGRDADKDDNGGDDKMDTSEVTPGTSSWLVDALNGVNGPEDSARPSEDDLLAQTLHSVGAALAQRSLASASSQLQRAQGVIGDNSFDADYFKALSLLLIALDSSAGARAAVEASRALMELRYQWSGLSVAAQARLSKLASEASAAGAGQGDPGALSQVCARVGPLVSLDPLDARGRQKIMRVEAKIRSPEAGSMARPHILSPGLPTTVHVSADIECLPRGQKLALQLRLPGQVGDGMIWPVRTSGELVWIRPSVARMSKNISLVLPAWNTPAAVTLSVVILSPVPVILGSQEIVVHPGGIRY